MSIKSISKEFAQRAGISAIIATYPACIYPATKTGMDMLLAFSDPGSVAVSLFLLTFFGLPTLGAGIWIGKILCFGTQSLEPRSPKPI